MSEYPYTMTPDERRERAAELRAEDAYSDPLAMLDAASMFSGVNTPTGKHVELLAGTVLVQAMTWARAVNAPEALKTTILNGAAARLLAAATALDASPTFRAVVEQQAAAWVDRNAELDALDEGADRAEAIEDARSHAD